MAEAKNPVQGDLTVTALYTSMTWVWGGFRNAELLLTRDAKIVFAVANVFLGVMKAFRWRLPSLRHSLVQRHALIDKAVLNANPRQVLEFAGGLSQRGIEMSADPGVHYIELDLPAMVEKKRQLLQRTGQGTEILKRRNFQLHAGDVMTTDWEQWIDPEQSVSIVAEGLLMYFSAEEQRQLWRRCAAVVQRHPQSTFIFDLLPFCEQPRPGILGRTLEFLLKRFTQGQSLIFDQRTRFDIAAELRAAGFSRVDTLEPRSVPKSWGIPYLGRRTQMLIFRCS
ncbi:class I SAM-dependent methyltransferase [Oligoflexus tunisiensis]|uniref:class I SAM-dependent methyltransferase n=1 Tax=Oligoflexus tunisiensis TaxID=708132 RepID=UPI00114CB5AF|nr:class I SAM-dependent methyltransferase [Oligoflexus tunisiensis]